MKTPVKFKDPVPRILELKRQNKTHREIADLLNEEGYRTKRGKPFPNGMIHYYLNPKRSRKSPMINLPVLEEVSSKIKVMLLECSVPEAVELWKAFS